jgi:serine protease Do
MKTLLWISLCFVPSLGGVPFAVTVSNAVADEPTDSPTKTDTSESESELIQAGPRALSQAFRNAAQKATPAVVTILTYGQPVGSPTPSGGSPPTRPRRGGQPNPSPADGDQSNDDSNPEVDEDESEPVDNRTDANVLTGLGSGIIISAGGQIITNNHVIANAKRVVVQLFDETEFTATKVYGDPASDVATLKIDREEPFPYAGLGDSDAVEIGDWVLAIGSPFQLEATVSAGIISAKNRSLRRISRGRMIQTDAAINPGNSGGPLIDLDGNVVAISTAIATRNGGYQGIGFAVPVNHAKWIANELATHGIVRRAAIGLRIAELNPKIAAKFNLPVGLGVLAYQVIEDSAADRAGIRPVDVIAEIDGERVTDPASLQSIVERKPVGSFQKFKLIRAGEELIVEVEIASLEDPTLTAESGEEAETQP